MLGHLLCRLFFLLLATGLYNYALANVTKQATTGFHSRIIWPIPAEIIDKMRNKSWHQHYGCPSLQHLSYIELTYWGYDDKPHQGVLIIARELAPQVVSIFRQLYQHKFPIYSMKPMYLFAGNDQLAMEQNNTSAFNCRLITGSRKRLSLHSYGRAIDINSLTNPYVNGRTILPKNHVQAFAHAKPNKGKISRDTLIYKLFKKYGWQWGGDWCGIKDYQHFEKRSRSQKRVVSCALR